MKTGRTRRSLVAMLARHDPHAGPRPLDLVLGLAAFAALATFCLTLVAALG